jgi:hypothetical protein
MNAPPTGDTFLGVARLFRIEVRRSLGFWLFPLLVGVAWYTSRESVDDGVAVWVEDSRRIGFALVLLGPLLGGLAAWEAGREERSRLGELSATVSRPPIWRDLSRWAAITSWGVLAYVVAGAYIFLLAVRDATWGGPLLPPIVVGLVGLIAYSAVGFAIGTFVPSRFIVPLVPVILYFAEGLPTGLGYASESPTRFLTPWTIFDSTPFPIQSAAGRELSWNLVVWLLGMTGVSMATVAVRRRPEAGSVVGLACSSIVTAVGAFLLLTTDVKHANATVALPPPTCTVRGIEVCLHPAYEAVLDDTADVIGVVIEPLIGVPGAPKRAIEYRYRRTDPAPNEMADVGPFIRANGIDITAEDFVRQILTTNNSTHQPCDYLLSNAQHAIASALLTRGGWELQTNPMGPITCEVESKFQESETARIPLRENPAVNAMQADIQAAADRFAALSIDEQRAWFMTHYADLRAGSLNLEDLP